MIREQISMATVTNTQVAEEKEENLRNLASVQ